MADEIPAPQPARTKPVISGFFKSVLEKVAIAVITAAILAFPFRELAIYVGRHVSAQSEVPVGTILPFWGSINDIPDDYEICDGGPPKKTGISLRGNKPLLTSTFLRGANAGVDDVRSNPSGRGGIDETPAFQSQTEAISLTIAQMPAHQHEIPLTHLQEGAIFGSGPVRGRVPVSSSIADHATFLSSPQGEGKPHSHGFLIPAHSNLPSYQEVLFIIKVR